MRKTIEQKRLEFLEDTIAYYSEDVNRRAVNNMRCSYKTEDGKKCAIGRYISEKKYNSIIEGHGVGSSVVYKLLPKKILDLDIDFLDDIQDLHDQNYHWDKNGLTEKGIDFKNKIIEKFIKND